MTTNIESKVRDGYAEYGIRVSGATDTLPKAELDTIILSVIINPPKSIFVATLPALLLHNLDNINFERLADSLTSTSDRAKLGYIIDVTRHIIDPHTKTKLPIPETLDLQPSKEDVLWIPQLQIFLGMSSNEPYRNTYEAKWKVKSTFELEDFKRYILEYAHA